MIKHNQAEVHEMIVQESGEAKDIKDSVVREGVAGLFHHFAALALGGRPEEAFVMSAALSASVTAIKTMDEMGAAAMIQAYSEEENDSEVPS